jgi:hypothetical protein
VTFQPEPELITWRLHLRAVPAAVYKLRFQS